MPWRGTSPDDDPPINLGPSGAWIMRGAPLDGIRIIDCSLLGPGALTMHLADLGAEVIKVEPPAGDPLRHTTWPMIDGVSLMHLHINRTKRSIGIDLRTPAGADIFRDLARTADVIIEGMRPGALARRGLGYEELAAINPRLILFDLRVRVDRSVPGHPEPWRRLRRMGRSRHPGDR